MTVHVKDESDMPVRQATVSLNLNDNNMPSMRSSILTDNNGEAIIESIHSGDYKIQVSADGMFSKMLDKNVTCNVEDCTACNPMVVVYLVRHPTTTTTTT